jgi:hypothetical protein
VAKTTRVVLTCDLHADGTEAVTTIRLDNGTAGYELDLCQTHLAELTGAGRRLRPRRRTGGAASATKAANKKAAAKTRRRVVRGRWSERRRYAPRSLSAAVGTVAARR